MSKKIQKNTKSKYDTPTIHYVDSENDNDYHTFCGRLFRKSDCQINIESSAFMCGGCENSLPARNMLRDYR